MLFEPVKLPVDPIDREFDPAMSLPPAFAVSVCHDVLLMMKGTKLVALPAGFTVILFVPLAGTPAGMCEGRKLMVCAPPNEPSTAPLTPPPCCHELAPVPVVAIQVTVAVAVPGPRISTVAPPED